MTKYRNKTIKFNMENEADKALWDYLQGLPHGLFSAHTKEMWEETKSMRSTTEKYYKDEVSQEEPKHIKLNTVNDPIETRKKLHHIFEGGVNE